MFLEEVNSLWKGTKYDFDLSEHVITYNSAGMIILFLLLPPHWLEAL
jgi:hypothetical protein